jgi:hypothetical protein
MVRGFRLHGTRLAVHRPQRRDRPVIRGYRPVKHFPGFFSCKWAQAGQPVTCPGGGYDLRGIRLITA